MAVHATLRLQEQFDDAEDFLELTLAFDQWKAKGAQGEFDSYLFGKDSAYISPKVQGVPYSLRHVHLVPISHTEQLAKWNKAWKTRSRKTSDRVLVYVDNGAGDCLLIFILPEPEAHEIAAMKTLQDKTLMESFAEVAAAYLETGDIIV
jgi:mRNA interferase YafO